MAFDATIIHWRTIAEFAAALATIRRPAWCVGITHHNTYSPDDLHWRGMASMLSMRDYYRDTKEWPSGPNLFLAAQCPNPADRGIWQMTPITHPGTHAGACNHDHLGIESVGDFQARPPSPDQYALLLAVTRLIMQQWGFPPASVNVHRDCMPGRTCPGKFLTSTQIRADLGKAPPKPKPPAPYRVHGLPVYQRSDRTGALWGFLHPGEEVLIDDPKSGHLADGRGFVDTAGLEPL